MPGTDVLLSTDQAAQAAHVTRRQFFYLVDQGYLEPAVRGAGSGSSHKFRLTQALAVRVCRPLLTLRIHPDLETVELVVKDGIVDGVWCDFNGKLYHVKAAGAPLPRTPMVWLPVPRPSELRS